MTELKGKRAVCLRCGNKWIIRFNRRPSACPACKSPWWDKPRRYKVKKENRAKRRWSS